MDAAALKAMQAPLKATYSDDPGAALVTLRADGNLDGTACDFDVSTVMQRGWRPDSRTPFAGSRNDERIPIKVRLRHTSRILAHRYFANGPRA